MLLPARRRSARAALVPLVAGWIGFVLVLDRADLGAPPSLQRVLGVGTWVLLVVLLRRQQPLVRVQTLLVVLFATAVEYTFAPLLGAYSYRLDNVPAYVPPGHGLVYLAAYTLGAGTLLRRHARLAALLTVLAGGAWAVVGLLDPARPDLLGAVWFICLALFLGWGPNRLLYVGAFLVVSWLELVGTRLGTWAWAPSDPVWHVVGQGNPPSGAAGGYGWFDLYATLLAPWVLRLSRRARARLGRLWRLRRRRSAAPGPARAADRC